MSLIRPEARAALWRWREVLTGAAVLGLGLWWGIGTNGILPWIGGIVGLAGAALVLAGLQRARFRTGSGGPGVVQVDEGRIAYFGPLTGGAVALSEIAAVTLDQSGRPGHWVLSQPGQPDLHVPLNAEGAEALFDAFAALPGFRTERMLAAIRQRGTQQVSIWRRSGHAGASIAHLH